MFSILKSNSAFEKDFMRIIVILEHTYAFLKVQLSEVFDAQSDVMIVVDRRFVERRQISNHFSPERRHAKRRREHHQVCKAVIAG